MQIDFERNFDLQIDGGNFFDKMVQTAQTTIAFSS